MTVEELAKPVYCSRCGKKAVHTTRGGFHLWNCPLQPRGHGIVKKAPFTDEEMQALKTAEQASGQQQQVLTVAQEREAAGLTADGRPKTGGVDDIAEMTRDEALPEEKPDFLMLATTPEFREWVKDPKNQEAFAKAALADAEELGHSSTEDAPSTVGLDANAAEQAPAAATITGEAK